MEKEILQENHMSFKLRHNKTQCESHIFGPKLKYSIQQVSKDTQYIKASQTGNRKK